MSAQPDCNNATNKKDHSGEKGRKEFLQCHCLEAKNSKKKSSLFKFIPFCFRCRCHNALDGHNYICLHNNHHWIGFNVAQKVSLHPYLRIGTCAQTAVLLLQYLRCKQCNSPYLRQVQVLNAHH